MVVILNALESGNSIENTLIGMLVERGQEYSCFNLREMNILPCRSCGFCGVRTPGKCIIDDDIHPIMRAIAKSSTMVMLTPIRFGGYSSQLKKVVDRMMPMGMPFYMVKDGHLLHPMRYGHKSLLAIGVAEENLRGQEENFRTLVDRNALNMQFAHKALIFKPSDGIKEIEYGIGHVLMEVKQ